MYLYRHPKETRENKVNQPQTHPQKPNHQNPPTKNPTTNQPKTHPTIKTQPPKGTKVKIVQLEVL